MWVWFTTGIDWCWCGKVVVMGMGMVWMAAVISGGGHGWLVVGPSLSLLGGSWLVGVVGWWWGQPIQSIITEIVQAAEDDESPSKWAHDG
jgi:hypothetical protein